MNVEPLEGVLRPGALDRALLHVFVAGPGVGEGILVALPGGGWIAIDGCKVGDAAVLDALLDTWRGDEPLELLVLTHPHEDHAAGVPILLERHSPREVMVTAGSPIGPNLVKHAEAYIKRLAASMTDDELKLRHAKAALIAISAWAETHASQLIDGADGVQRAWRSTTLSVRAPHECAHLSAVLSEIAKGQLAHSNEASLVLELVFGRARVVLGGDLPHRRTGAGVVDTGWESVVSRHPHLAEHVALKIPHHGSAHARHDALLERHADRVWLITPYNKQRQPLPRVFDPDGLAAWLEHENAVHATSLSSDVSAPASSSALSLPIGSLARRTVGGGDPFASGATELTPRQHRNVAAPVWGVAFDDAGAVRGLWRGDSAVRITR